MKKFVLAPVLALLATSLTLGIAPAVEAHSPDKRKCATRHEYRHVAKGQTKRRVHRNFDTRGQFWDGHGGGYTRMYEPCWTRPKDGELHGHPRMIFIEYWVTKKGKHLVAGKRIAVPS